MNIESKPQFRPKPERELENQFKDAYKLNPKILPKKVERILFSTPESELKESYPNEYAQYIDSLREVSKGNHEIKRNIHYTQHELGELHRGIIGDKINDDLKKKIELDPYIRNYSAVVLFPEIYERVYEKKEKPDITQLSAATRDRVLKVAFSDKSYVVKSAENGNEIQIANKMAELGVGPKQYHSLIGYLTEEYIEGRTISKLDPKIATKEYMHELGIKIGKALKKIHDLGIVVNDQLLVDDFGKSHTIILDSSEIKFIDFGASVNVSKFPNITDDDVFNLMRTDPMMMFQLNHSGVLSIDKVKPDIEKYRRFLMLKYKTSKQLIEAVDYQLIGEGTKFLGNNLENTYELYHAIIQESGI